MKRALIIVALVSALLIGAGAWLNYSAEFENHPGAQESEAVLIERGAYLARAGNCVGCHTARGGATYAGGRGIPTPFGTVYSSNLTSDPQTGLGDWTRDDFWRALHNGRSKDGRFLYPAFPYTDYTRVTRADADALHAYFRSLPPVRQKNRAHALRFPYNTQLLLAGWRAFFFRPGIYKPEAEQSAEWNRGAYLVSGLGHCGACHAPRNAFGATIDSVELSGGLIPMQGWYAPSLAASDEAGLQHWERAQIVQLLGAGISPRASVLGPMAEVVYRSTQYLSANDLQAMALYLQSLPQQAPSHTEPAPIDPNLMRRGRTLYESHCADCHGEQGEGVPQRYPALAGNRAVTMEASANAVLSVLNGGFAPATAGNPRPWGMPPFATTLSEEEVAVVLTYIRNAWGNRASPVQVWEVSAYTRGAAGH